VSLSASTTASPSGMVQRGLDADHVMVYRSRAEELSGRHGGADSRLDKVGSLIPPKDGFAEDGGGNRSVCGGVC
jgi:hypothetical protein